MPTTTELREKADGLRRQAAELEVQAIEVARKCNHQWCAPVYDPIVIAPSYDPGDPPGTMGVDRRLPSYFSGSEKKRWRRNCRTCGTVEYTTNEVSTGTRPVF